MLVDFYLADQLLCVDGIMALDDSWMASIRTVANFVVANRAYQRVEHSGEGMTAFRKLGDDDRDWRHFRPFEVVKTQPAGSDSHPARRASTGAGVLHPSP